MNGPNKDPQRQNPERMLGGYATENLSEQEKQELFSAALQDQQLFDALMEEESLRQLLHQPGAKAELLDALQPKETPLSRFRRWLATPMAWGAAGAVAAAAVLVVMLVPRTPDSQPSLKIARQEAVIQEPPKESAVPTAPAPQQANEVRQMARARKIEAEPKRETPPERDQQSLADNAPPPSAQQQVQQPAFEQQALRQDRQMQVQTTPPPPAAIAEQGPPPAPQVAAPAPPPPPRQPVEYVLLKRNDQGAYSPATSFRDSDAVRIQVTVHESGYMALTRQGESKPLVTAQPVRAGQIVQIPPTGFLLPSSRPYRLEFTRQPAAPGRVGIIGGFRAGSSRAVSSSDEAKQELSKTKDAAVPQPLVIEILIPGSTN